MAQAVLQKKDAESVLFARYAAELAAEVFVSFDDEQLDLAKAAGLKAIRPD